jgi:hypothetical protein
MLTDYLKLPTTKTYYEYGSDNILVASNHKNIEKITIIESDGQTNYYAKLIAKENEKIDLQYIDVGSYGTLGFPKQFNLGLDYYTHIDKLDYVPDVIMINGRWRVECALHAFNKANEDTIILFYDWDREEYKGIFAAFDLEKVVGKLARLTKKKDEVIPTDALFFYQFDPR